MFRTSLPASACRRLAAWFLLAALVLVSCEGIGPTLEPYVPPVVFSGMLNGETVTLPGHRGYPNECYLDHDTVKIVACSDDYAPAREGNNGIAQGTFMRVNIYPLADDSQDIVSIDETLFHLVTHGLDRTCTYHVVPADSNDAVRGLQMTIGTLNRRRGSSVELREITVSCPALGTHCGQSLVVTEGAITGRITR